MWFAYTWNIDPDASKIVGPFNSRDDAVSWINDESEVENAGVMQLPFEFVRRAADRSALSMDEIGVELNAPRTPHNISSAALALLQELNDLSGPEHVAKLLADNNYASDELPREVYEAWQDGRVTIVARAA